VNQLVRLQRKRQGSKVDVFERWAVLSRRWRFDRERSERAEKETSCVWVADKSDRDAKPGISCVTGRNRKNVRIERSRGVDMSCQQPLFTQMIHLHDS
jgi:hypothetical protein